MMYYCYLADYLLDVLWETDEFRLSIQREIEAVFPEDTDGLMESDEPRNPAEAENRIFARAKNAADYLGLATSVIQFLKNKTAGGGSTSSEAASDRCNRQPCPAVFPTETISLDRFRFLPFL
jgi:hypothetical protein